MGVASKYHRYGKKSASTLYYCRITCKKPRVDIFCSNPLFYSCSFKLNYLSIAKYYKVIKVKHEINREYLWPKNIKAWWDVSV
jgi:hypothetical protein